MNNNAWFKKEYPFQTVIGYGGGATGFGAHSSSSKTYLDDVFSTDVWIGNETARTISTGVDNNKGALVWVKSRNDAHDHHVVDTERGANQLLYINSNVAQANTANRITGFTNDGYTIGSAGQVNGTSAYQYAGWNFRKAKGFFDVITWTGDGVSGREISHSLECKPGMIIVKCTSETQHWIVYHCSTGATRYGILNNNDAITAYQYTWQDTEPTSSVFTVGNTDWTNANTKSYVAYVFAGGDVASGTSANIDITSKTVTNLGGTFDSTHTMAKMTDGILETSNAQNMAYVNASANPSNPDMDVYVDLDTPHVVTKYRIGPQGGNGTSGYNLVNNFNVYGTNDTSSWDFVASFAPGQSGWTGGAYRDFEWGGGKSYRYWRIQVTQGDSGNNKSISEWKIEGYSTAVDTSSYLFGEDGDKNIISCGSYVGNGGTDDGPEINCGWEPQLVLIKKASANENWMFLDTIRGLPVDAGSAYLNTNDADAENTSGGAMVNVSARGFRVVSTDGALNSSGADYVYMAIRRPDSYVATPASAGTDVFTMSVGSSDNPRYTSGFPVDFAWDREPGGTSNWLQSSRLRAGNYSYLNEDWAEAGHYQWSYDWSTGWSESTAATSSKQSWMWKRCQGYDNLIYNVTGGVAGTYGVGQQTIQHNLGRAPEMIWQKYLGTQNSGEDSCIVYHKDLTSNYWLKVDSAGGESDGGTGYWGTSAPTATTFDIKGTSRYLGNHFYMLFASVTGISKVGSYAGTGSQLTVTTGFQPRFIIIKSITSSGRNWLVFDTLRGWAAGNEAELNLNKDEQQNTFYDFGTPTSTGFTAEAVNDDINASGHTYIYYAHA